MRKEIIGQINFSGTVDITDPCYNKEVWCRMNQVPIKKGKYTCMVWMKDGTVGIIGIYYGGVIPRQSHMKEIGEIGVDAGLAGFFHNKPDYDDETWTDLCNLVREGKAWITKDGFFSFSGYGDGGYGVYAYKTEGETTALEIRFM